MSGFICAKLDVVRLGICIQLALKKTVCAYTLMPDYGATTIVNLPQFYFLNPHPKIHNIPSS